MAVSALSRLNRIRRASSTPYFLTVPDVALDASPGTGVPVYDTYYGYQWVQVGGIELVFAGLAAFMACLVTLSVLLAMEIRPSRESSTDMYQTTYPSGNYALDFHDITTGSSGGICVAGTGYDYVTGVGTPIANHLANDLLPLP